MKMVKSLLLGSAAGLVAMAGAQAADLPVKAKPVQYVKICSLYGAGFYYIPGTDTCIKIGGFIRAEMNFNSGNSFNPYHTATGSGALDGRGLNYEQTRARGVVSFDVRSQTEYGTLRSYINGGWQSSNGSGGSGIGVYSNRLFIQWAGFTAGLASSFFDFYVTPRYSNTTNVLGSDTGGGGDVVFAYTAQLGNGFSATLSTEDTSTRRTAIATAVTTAAVTGTYAGRQWPDVVGNLRIDQAWGSAQIMAAAHQVRDSVANNKVGWAAGAGLMLNLPWNKGDTFTTQVTYAKGALAYVGSGLSNFAIETGATDAFGPVYDGVIVAGGGLDLTSGWSVVAGMNHRWNPMWNTSIYGGYGHIDYSTAAGVALNAGGAGYNADWAFWQVGSRTQWTPVKNLVLSVDLMYNHVDTSGNGLAVGANPYGLTAGNTLGDVGWLQGMFRVQRNFWP